jgi:hypothetical protein
MTLAEGYANLALFYRDANVLTALGSGLDSHGVTYGIPRIQESPSVYVFSYATLPPGVTTEDLVGVSYQDNLTGLNYEVTEALNNIQVLAEAATPGAAPSITGLVPLDTDVPVSSWFVQTYGSNEEDDEDYRARILNYIRGGAIPGSLNSFKTLYQSVLRPGYSRVFPVNLQNSTDMVIYCLNNAMGLLSASEKNRIRDSIITSSPLFITPSLLDPMMIPMTVSVNISGINPKPSYHELVVNVIQSYLKDEIAPLWDRTMGYGHPLTGITVDAGRIRSLVSQIPGILTVSSVSLTIKSATTQRYDLTLTPETTEWVYLSGVTIS